MEVVDILVRKYYFNLKCFPFLRTSFDMSNHPEMFLVKAVLKICSQFTAEHP